VTAVASQSRGLLGKELREGRWKAVTAIGLLVLFGGMLGPLYDWIAGLMPQLRLDQLPEWIRGSVDAQLGNYFIYLWGNWYGKNLLQMLLLFGVVFGAALIAGETSRGSAGFLFSKPVRRAAILRSKYVVSLAIIWAAAVLGTLATVIGSWVAGRPEGWGPFSVGLPAGLAGAAVALSVGLVWSVVARDTVKAIVASAITIGAYSMLAVFERLRPYSYIHRMAGGATAMTGRVEWGAVAVMMAVAVALVAVAEAILGRMDI
jgi:ABC-type transport system involved in multi-copper enzyme maturation permease subunit